MFTSNIGRLRFFSYSAAVLVAEIVAMVLCIAGTVGFEGLMDSKPGPGREGLATAVLVISLVVALFRGNFAWRRSRDAQGSTWILWSYIVFSAFYAVLQAGTVLIVDFDNPDEVSGGLNLLGLGLFGFWIAILVAKPAGGDLTELTSVFDFDDLGPAAPLGATKSKSYSPPAAGVAARPSALATRAATAPARPSFPGKGGARPGGFGKRGLA